MQTHYVRMEGTKWFWECQEMNNTPNETHLNYDGQKQLSDIQ